MHASRALLDAAVQAPTARAAADVYMCAICSRRIAPMLIQTRADGSLFHRSRDREHDVLRQHTQPHADAAVDDAPVSRVTEQRAEARARTHDAAADE